MGADTVLLGDALEAPALAALMARIPLQVLRIEIVCAMESLPEHEREEVLLRDIKEMAVDELASTLDLRREALNLETAVGHG
jgi:RNA polymerase sigma-70 factor (ECF subfamily)